MQEMFTIISSFWIVSIWIFILELFLNRNNIYFRTPESWRCHNIAKTCTALHSPYLLPPESCSSPLDIRADDKLISLVV